MTEAEWLACVDPTPMLEFLRGRASDRKLRLFACACVRRAWHLLLDERSRVAVSLAERHADHPMDEVERDAVRDAAFQAAGDIAEQQRARNGGRPLDTPFDPLYRESWMYLKAANAATLAVGETATDAAANVPNRSAVALQLERHGHIPERERAQTAWREERTPQAALLRDIFGNPFRPASLVPAWRTETVLAMARGIYEERAFDRMPILADSLQDAGCTDEDVLGHCRGPGPHARGCWVVDLILGKT